MKPAFCLTGDSIIPLEHDEHEGWSFNLAANAFIIYTFTDIEQFYHNHPGPKPPIPRGGMGLVKDMLNEATDVVHCHDNLDALRAYNWMRYTSVTSMSMAQEKIVLECAGYHDLSS